MPRPGDETIRKVYTMLLQLCDGGLGLERSVTCSALGAMEQACTLHERTCRTSTCVPKIGGPAFGRLQDARHLYWAGALICLRSYVPDLPGGSEQDVKWVRRP